VTRDLRGWDRALDVQNHIRASGFWLGTDKAPPTRIYSGTGEVFDRSTPLVLPEHGSMKANIYAALGTVGVGDPMWISRDVCHLVSVAAESFSCSEALYLDDVFAPYVFAYLAEPWTYDFGAMSGEMRMISWAVTQIGDNPGDMGLLMAHWDQKPDGTIWLHYAGDIGFGDDAMRITPVEGKSHPEWESGFRGFFAWMQVLWRLAQQEIVVPGREQVARQIWRHKANVREIKTVQVLTLRRAKARRCEDDGQGVEWSHRWPVRGHWRAQWFPKLKRHCQIWIEPHVKGPQDKPFVAKRRAIEFVR